MPAEAPEDRWERTEEGLHANCDGETVDASGIGAYYAVRCDCGWCNSAYWGAEYCVRKSRLEGWLESMCPQCGYQVLNHEDGWPTAVKIRCDGCGD